MADELARRQRIIDEDAAAEAERAKGRVTPDAAARIMAEAGMTPRRLAAVKRFPLACSVDEAEAKAADWDRPAAHWSEGAAPDSPEFATLRKSRDGNALIRAAREFQAVAEARADADEDQP